MNDQQLGFLYGFAFALVFALMALVLYQGVNRNKVRVFLWDSEGHIINTQFVKPIDGKVTLKNVKHADGMSRDKTLVLKEEYAYFPSPNSKRDYLTYSFRQDGNSAVPMKVETLDETNGSDLNKWRLGVIDPTVQAFHMQQNRAQKMLLSTDEKKSVWEQLAIPIMIGMILTLCLLVYVIYAVTHIGAGLTHAVAPGATAGVGGQ